MNMYYCEHDTYYEDRCDLCDIKNKEIEQSKNFYVAGRKNMDMKIIEDLVAKARKRRDILAEKALNEALEAIKNS